MVRAAVMFVASAVGIVIGTAAMLSPYAFIFWAVDRCVESDRRMLEQCREANRVAAKNSFFPASRCR